MIDELTKNKLFAIAFGDRVKGKDRIAACKLLLEMGIEVNKTCNMLHELVNNDLIADFLKVKAIALLDKYEIGMDERTVESTEEAESNLMKEYGIV